MDSDDNQKLVLGWITAMAVVFLIYILIRSVGIWDTKTFGVAQQDAERQKFEQTKAYRDGLIHELEGMRFEYVRADVAHKPGLRSVILHRAEEAPRDVLPLDMLEWLDGLRKESY